MDQVDSQTLDGGPPQRLVDPPLQHAKHGFDHATLFGTGVLVSEPLTSGSPKRHVI
jgi:hypothetical protein